MKQDPAGWCHPDVMSGTHAYIARAREMRPALTRIPGRKLAVQAGGHVGVVPVMLADYLDRVITFEPEPRNLQCLRANIANVKNVEVIPGALGPAPAMSKLVIHLKSTGAHYLAPSAKTGDVPVYTIDGLALTECSAIFLDTEGYELEILKGAVKTIERFRPLICAEENKQMKKYGRAPGDLERWLRRFDYRFTVAVGEDLVFT